MSDRPGHQINTLHHVIASGWIKNWRLAVDGGAYHGHWSKLMAEHFQKVIAFEPSPRNYQIAAANLGDIENALIFQEALLDTNATAVIANTSKSEKPCSDWVQPDGRGDVHCVPLDSLPLLALDLLKLDLEGAEWHALQGAALTIKSFRPVIILEISRHARRYGREPMDAARLLMEWGYRQVHFTDPDMVLIP